MEMFHAFGFSERVLKEACWINETTFWKPDDKQPANIIRSGWVQDVEDGLSEFPHVVLNQARVHDFYPRRHAPIADETRAVLCAARDRRSIRRGVGRGPRVTVTLERLDPPHEGQIETVKARYLVGCDGARSTVRTSIGRELRGDSANHAWGVMDVLAVTDFPDIRCKCLIQSAHEGSILIIPREGGYLFRLYVELTKLEVGERVASRNITARRSHRKAQRILHPYTLEVKEIPWWSVYDIGQRLTDKFDDVPEEEVATRLPSVFIAGDACHTHSPKAGQGMNVSMQDAFNLGWKLVAVLQDGAPPSLLHTYSAERRPIAKELIDFDREFAAMLASANGEGEPRPGQDPELFRQARTLYRGNGDALRSVDPDRRKDTSISPRISWLASVFIRRRSSASRMPSPFTSATSSRRMGAFGSSSLPGRGSRGGRVRPFAAVRFSRRSPQSPVRKYTRKTRTLTR